MLTKEEALKLLDDMDDYARMADIDPYGPFNALKQYIEDVNWKLNTLEKYLNSSLEILKSK
jgi:hypothetical protein